MALTYFATQAGSYAADATRRAVFSPYARTAANNPGIIAGGLLSASDLQLSAPASGMSVNISSGEAIVGGSEGGAQGAYHVYNSAQVNLSVPAANPTNPRIDAVVLTMADGQYTQPSDVGGTTNGPVLAEVVGTPTSGATLANLLGAPSIPLSSLLLGYVLVPATATNIVTADISNKASVVGFLAGSNVLQLLSSQQLQLQVGTTTVTTSSGPVGTLVVNHNIGRVPFVVATADPSSANTDVTATVTSRTNTQFTLGVYAAAQGGSWGYRVDWAAIG